MNIAIYTFHSSIDALPNFNSGYSYAYTDVDNGNGTKTRTITSDELPTSINFNGNSGLLTVDKLNINGLTSFSEMFYRCGSLTRVNTSGWDTTNITRLDNMFSYCISLTEIDLSSFNTSNVARLDYMFYGCTGLVSVNLNNWNTEKATTTRQMFYNCTKLTSLKFNSFNNKKITDTYGMFYDCNNLISVDMSASNVESINTIINELPTRTANSYGTLKSGVVFASDCNITAANSKYWNIENDNIVAVYTFNKNNDTIPVFNDGFGDVMIECVVKKGNSYSLFDISYPIEIEIYTDDLKFVSIEENEHYIKYIYTDNISGNLANPSQSYFMYDKTEGGYSYINLNSNYLDSVIFTVKVKGSGVIIKDEVLNNETTKRIIISNNLPTSINFTYKTGLVSLSYLNTSDLNSMKNMFYGCSNLTSIDVSSFNTSKVTDMSYMFFNCPILETITGLTNWDTSNVTNMNHMFYLCYKLSDLNLSSWNTRQVINMGSMFNSCESLSTLNLNNFNTDNVTTISSMFRNCQSLVSLNISNFDVSNASSLYEMFADCTSLISIDMCNFNIGNTAITEYMFYNCNSLVSVNMEDSNTKTINKVISNLPDRTSNNKGTLIVPNPKDSTINTSSAQSKYWNLEVPPQYAFDMDTMTYFISKIKEKFAAISELKNKVDKEEGKNLSTNNFSNEEKNHIENSFNDVTLVDNILVFYSTSESGDKVIIKTFDLDI